jgi:RecA/RadA recombinase
MSLYDELLQLVGNDVLELFGRSGSGKSSFANAVIRDALNAGKKVLYLDTERNLLEPIKGIDYRRVPKLDNLVSAVESIPSGYNLIVLDSLGMPVLIDFVRMNLKEQGEALKKCIGIAGQLKLYSEYNNALVIIINQPESELGKNKTEDELEPFGDKHVFTVKEIWRTKKMPSSNKDLTTCNITAFRSRRFGTGSLLYQLKIYGAWNDVKVDVVRKWSPEAVQQQPTTTAAVSK